VLQRVAAHGKQHGKTSVGWFYGFTPPFVVNGRGKLLVLCLTLRHSRLQAWLGVWEVSQSRRYREHGK
jgi:hypothetical protein